MMTTTNRAGRQPKLYSMDGKTQTLREWAAEYGVNRHTLWYRLKCGRTLRESLTCGRVPYPQGCREDVKVWKGARLDELQRILNDGHTPAEAAERFGVTSERVLQVIRKHGLATCRNGQPKDHIPVSDVAKTLKVAKPSDVRALIRSSDPVFQYGRMVWLPKSMVPLLRKRLAKRVDESRIRNCATCNRKFKYKKRQHRQVYCSQDCAPTSAEYRANPPQGATLTWHQDLVESLQSNGRHDEWCTLRDVCDFGLTKIQIIWLGQKGLLRTKEHPSRKWRGRPVNLYSRAEVAIAGRVYRRHKKRGTHTEKC